MGLVWPGELAHASAVFLVVCVGATWSCNTTQQHADLLAIMASIDGLSWNSTEPYCSWEGVACHESCVTELSLSSDKLSGTLPSEIGALTSMTDLTLFDTELSGTIPPDIASLTSLITVTLSNNKLSGTMPSEIGSLTSLTGLWLYDNTISGTIPSEIGSLTSLTALTLSNTELSGTMPSEIGSLTYLTDLTVSTNKLSGTIPIEIGSLTSLTALRLYNIKVSGTMPSEIGALTSLSILWLYDIKLSGTIPSEIGALAALTNLRLTDTKLTGTIPSEIGSLTSLTNLWLSSNKLSGIMPSEIGSLTSLLDLTLSNNQLSGTIPPEIGSLTSLANLRLSSNKLSGTIPSEIGSLTALTDLYCEQTALSGTMPPLPGNIIEMNVRETSLEGIFAQSLQFLVVLDISSTNLSVVDPPYKQWPALTDLRVAHTAIKTLPPLFHNNGGCELSGSLLRLNMSGVPATAGVLDNAMLCEPDCQNCPISLVSVTAAGSGIHAVDLSDLKSLATLILANNPITTLRITSSVFYLQLDGALAGDVRVPSLLGPAVVYLRGNPTTNVDLPSELTASSEVVADFAQKVLCSAGFTDANGIVTYLDPAMHAYSVRLCACFEGYHGHIAEDGSGCVPNAGLCEAGDADGCVDVRAEGELTCTARHWPAPACASASTFARCPFCADAVPCMATRAGVECVCPACVDGHTDRLCSRCSPGYYRGKGEACAPCPSRLGPRLKGRVFPAAGALAMMGLTAARATRWRLPGPAPLRRRAVEAAGSSFVAAALVGLGLAVGALSTEDALIGSGALALGVGVLFVLRGRPRADELASVASNTAQVQGYAALHAAPEKLEAQLRIVSGLMKTGLVYVQTMQLVGSMTLPGVLAVQSTVYSAISFDVTPGVGCLLGWQDHPFACTLIAQLAAPLGVLLAVWAAAAGAAAWASVPRHAVRAGVSATVLVVFVAIPRTSAAIIEVFACIPEAVCVDCEASGRVFVQTAPWVQCWQRAHYELAVVSFVAAAVYGGTVVAVFVLMARSRDGASPPDDVGDILSVFSLLWRPYKTTCWWFEAAVILRRVLVYMALSVFSTEGSNGRAAVSVVLCLALWVHCEMKPHRDALTYRMETVCLLVPLLTHAISLSVTSSPCYVITQECAQFSVVLLSIVHALTMIALVACVVHALSVGTQSACSSAYQQVAASHKP